MGFVVAGGKVLENVVYDMLERKKLASKEGSRKESSVQEKGSLAEDWKDVLRM